MSEARHLGERTQRAVGRKLEVHSVPSGLERWRHLAEIVALLAAAAWAIYVFVYQERIKPANEALRIQPNLLVHYEKLSARKEYVEVELDLKNLSGADASLDGMIVNVYGRSMAAAPAEQIESPLTGITELNRTLGLSPPKLLYSFYDTWHAFGAPASKVNVINGGQNFRERIAFGIRPGSFDILKVTYTFCYSRPGGQPWPIQRSRFADGAYRFAGVGLNASAVHCSAQRRGEFFPV